MNVISSVDFAFTIDGGSEPAKGPASSRRKQRAMIDGRIRSGRMPCEPTVDKNSD